LLRTGKPLFLAVNKVDTEKQQSLTDDFHRLGIRRLFPLSAENARGWTTCWMRFLKYCRHKNNCLQRTPKTARKKSRNRRSLTKQGRDYRASQRGQVHFAESPRWRGSFHRVAHPGTTRDAVDEIVERHGKRFRFIDTAGIRRKGKLT